MVCRNEVTKQHALDYLERMYPQALPYLNCNISDLCCEKLEKSPLKRVAKQSLLPLHVQAIYIHSLLASGREKEAYAVANYMENLANEMLKAGTLQQ